MSAADLVFTRLRGEEGEKLFAYDDATGARVRAPTGNLTWGRGFNLDQCGSSALFDVMERFLISQSESQLLSYPWYSQAGNVRQSVFLDIAYNAGVSNLLHFPKMISCAALGDWAGASRELLDSDAARSLPNRYQPLATLLLNG